LLMPSNSVPSCLTTIGWRGYRLPVGRSKSGGAVPLPSFEFHKVPLIRAHPPKELRIWDGPGSI
jgi:hypothetical protein